MAGFGFSGRRLWTDEEFEGAHALMEPEEFTSLHFQRAAETLNTLLVLFHGHREMPEFIRQLAVVVEDRPPDDPPASGVLSLPPSDGPPSLGGRSPHSRFERRQPMSMNIPTLPLERQLISVLAANREDSYATQRKRGTILGDVARTLHERFGLQKWDNLREKHIVHVVEAMKAADRGRRAIEEKLSHLRWLVRKIGKANLVPRSNKELGVEPGPRHTRAGKVISDERLTEMLSAVPDERVRTMMLLARHLGLRFKESALFRPGRDWQADRVWVKRGTKGGHPRYLFLHNPRQAEVLEGARRLASSDAGIIPSECRTFEEWRQYVYRVLRGAGVGRATDQTFHDLRRAYLCERMKYLVSVKGMDRDRAAAIVAREAGHHRLEILEWYIADSDDAPEAA